MDESSGWRRADKIMQKEAPRKANDDRKKESIMIR